MRNELAGRDPPACQWRVFLSASLESASKPLFLPRLFAVERILLYGILDNVARTDQIVGRAAAPPTCHATFVLEGRKIKCCSEQTFV